MDQTSSLSSNFDLNSQAGVMALLASIRASTISPADKNELRDLVFLYTNGGGDASVRITLEKKLSVANIQLVSIKKSSAASAPAAPVLSFGSSRPAPVFRVPSVATAPAPAPISIVTPPPASVVMQTPVSTPASISVPAPVITPAPAAVPLEQSAAVPVAPVQVPVEQVVAVPPPVQVVPSPTPVQPVTVPTPAPTPAPTPTPAPVQNPQPVAAPATQSAPAPVTPVQAAPAPSANYLERIREIKTAVNSKVGNPVNLVDINNEVGREYMNALLEAMKGLSGGAAGQIDFAMKRLETAYLAVEVAVAAHSKNVVDVANSPAAPAATPIAAPAPTPVISEPLVEKREEAVPVPAAPEAPLPPAPPAVPVPVAPPIPVVVPQPRPVPAQPIAQPDAVQIPVVQKPSAPEPVRKPVDVSGVSGYEIAQNQPPVKPPQSPSVADSVKVLTPQDLPSSSISASADNDPEGLMTRDIDDGLEQLLSDWSLFKKSGLFGTGPKGREHPLFKKLASLQIPLLLAGRFEGSTQDIKQSITDYMNGWRYEQGIIYEQGETFEHYLRRVIKQILDLQKKRRPA